MAALITITDDGTVAIVGVTVENYTWFAEKLVVVAESLQNATFEETHEAIQKILHTREDKTKGKAAGVRVRDAQTPPS